ncbi:MAG: 2-dehydro-3-deoxy-6-phosphogalactonate aldolase [Pseudomonadota bacterium]
MTDCTINALDPLPLVAILRGLVPEEAVAIGEAIADAGFLCLEVPLNSPRPLESIELLRKALDGRVLVGAGTVLTVADVEQVADAGGQLCVSPNVNVDVIKAAKARGLVSMPGFLTPSEAFLALSSGADAIKLFPAETIGPKGLQAIMAVLPAQARVYAVGGIAPGNIAEWQSAGASGFGIGSSLFKPGQDPLETGRKAAAFVAAMDRGQP